MTINARPTVRGAPSDAQQIQIIEGERQNIEKEAADQQSIHVSKNVARQRRDQWEIRQKYRAQYYQGR